MVEIRI